MCLKILLFVVFKYTNSVRTKIQLQRRDLFGPKPFLTSSVRTNTWLTCAISFAYFTHFERDPVYLLVPLFISGSVGGGRDPGLLRVPGGDGGRADGRLPPALRP